MAAIDIVLIGGVEHRAPVACKLHVLDLEVPGSKKRRLAPITADGVEMQPAVRLPREDQKTICTPKQFFAMSLAKSAATSFSRCPDRVALTGRSISHMDRPGDRCPAVVRRAFRLARHANERNMRAVRRPHRIAVVCRSGIQIAQALRSKIVDADEAMIPTVCRERNRMSVWRPAERSHFAARMKQLLRLHSIRLDAYGPNLSM